MIGYNDFDKLFVTKWPYGSSTVEFPLQFKYKSFSQRLEVPGSKFKDKSYRKCVFPIVKKLNVIDHSSAMTRSLLNNG